MTPIQITLLIIAGITVLGFLPFAILSFILYSEILTRNRPDKWQRVCSAPEDRDCLRMYHAGLEWAKKYESVKKEVSIKNRGLRLRGEYFDFGGDRAAIIIPGRTETLVYSYYFAEPLRAAGCNVLVIDNRATGLSGGRLVGLGYTECRDTIAWARYLHDAEGVSSVILHGVCIGSSTSLFAAIRSDCPEYVEAVISEGMYTSFYETFRTHMKRLGHSNFPLTYGVMMWLRLLTGAKPMTYGPEKAVLRMRKPILFLHSREDVFSLPEKSQTVYDRCTSYKTVVWFEHGAHSRIRINNREKYDSAIKDFIGRL